MALQMGGVAVDQKRAHRVHGGGAPVHLANQRVIWRYLARAHAGEFVNLPLARADEDALALELLHAEHALDDFDIPERIVLPAERHASVKANARIAAVLHDELRRVGLL